MSFDLYQKETSENLDQFPLTDKATPGGFDQFLTTAGNETMRGLAQTGRALSMAAGAVPAAIDYFRNDTTLSDSYFKFHDETFNNAVDYWTPNPNETSVAGQITGQLLSTLPLLLSAPSAFVAASTLAAKTHFQVSEDLVREGIDPGKALATGAVQGTGAGIGVFVPVLGRTLAQRVLLGGAGFNVLQGVVSRGISGEILKGTPAEEDYQAFDKTSITLDALLGAAFGVMTHLSPTQRAQGEEFLQKLQKWITPEQVDAVATMREAQHLNADSLPGKPVDQTDIAAHTERAKRAVSQLANDEPVHVTDMREPNVTPDSERMAANSERVKELQATAESIRSEEGLPQIKEAPETLQVKPEDIESAKPITLGTDPVLETAKRFVSEQPDAVLTVGKDVEGNPIQKSAKDFLDEADAAVKQANKEASLFKVAAACLFGGGA